MMRAGIKNFSWFSRIVYGVLTVTIWRTFMKMGQN